MENSSNSKVLDIVSSLTMNDFTVDELRIIHETLRMTIEQAQRRVKATFKRGDRVSFTDRQGRRVEGVIEKICNKTVTVLAQGKWDTATDRWRIAPNLLTLES